MVFNHPQTSNTKLRKKLNYNKKEIHKLIDYSNFLFEWFDVISFKFFPSKLSQWFIAWWLTPKCQMKTKIHWKANKLVHTSSVWGLLVGYEIQSKKISDQLNCLSLSDFLNHMLYNPFPTSCPNDSCDNLLHVSKQLEVQPKFHNLERKLLSLQWYMFWQQISEDHQNIFLLKTLIL